MWIFFCQWALVYHGNSSSPAPPMFVHFASYYANYDNLSIFLKMMDAMEFTKINHWPARNHCMFVSRQYKTSSNQHQPIIHTTNKTIVSLGTIIKINFKFWHMNSSNSRLPIFYFRIIIDARIRIWTCLSDQPKGKKEQFTQ